MHKHWMVGVLGLALTVMSVSAAEVLTYADLARRLTDLERLATPPADGERGAMESSYDRVSKYDADTGQYIKWDANGDGRGVVRDLGDREVLADIQGAGVIWRLWSALAGSGKVSVYLDGATEPALELPFHNYFDKSELWPWENLVYLRVHNETSSQRGTPGANSFVPIPFSKSCLIVGDKEIKDDTGKTTRSGWGQYFQANYILYPAGTELPKFQWPLSAENKAALDAANAALAPEQLGKNPAPQRAGQTTEKKTLTVSGSSGATVADLSGSGAITGLRVKLDLPKDKIEQQNLLRQLTVSVTWDDDKEPAVWSPLGDFFGVIGGAAPFRTLAAGLLEDGTLYAYWYMPFGKRAKIEVGNDGPLTVTMDWEIDRAPLTVSADKLSRFHAKWHRDAFLPERADRKIDWTLLVTKGRGRLVGVMLHVWNPRGWWWGEGDEKFFVDGEKFPSTFGTGSEDYFGYAWCAPGYFARPTHAQPLNEFNVGNIDNLRWHITDNVPFHTGFEAYIEKYFPSPEPGKPLSYSRQALYAAVAYWYLAAGGEDPYRPLPVSERVGYFTPPVADYHEPGVLEGEALVQKFPRATPARWPEPQAAWANYGSAFKPGVWSGDWALAWSTGRAPGAERLELLLPVTVSGKYRVTVRLTNGEVYGIYQFSVDDEKLGAPVDCYAPALSAGAPVTLGEVSLLAGEHVLRIELSGRNAAVDEKKESRFALDYIKLEPIK